MLEETIVAEQIVIHFRDGQSFSGLCWKLNDKYLFLRCWFLVFFHTASRICSPPYRFKKQLFWQNILHAFSLSSSDTPSLLWAAFSPVFPQALFFLRYLKLASLLNFHEKKHNTFLRYSYHKTWLIHSSCPRYYLLSSSSWQKEFKICAPKHPYFK